MTILDEMQFELLPTLAAGDGQVFGIGAGVSVDDGGFIPGEDQWQSEDEVNTRRGGIAFGRDLLLGPTWGFNLHVNQSDVKTAKVALGNFKTAWRAAHIRQTPGAVIPLRYRLGDEIRRVYGRPDRISAPPDNMILGGFIPITCDFKCVDGNTYDDIEQAITLAARTGSAGGFTYPLVYPVTSLPVSSGSDQAVVGGSARTYPVIRFNGPVTNPSLETAAWTLKLNMTIPNGQYVEVDLRPWAISVLLNGTANVSGAIGRRTYLEDMAFEPGRHELIYRASTTSSASTCEVRWSNAHNSL